MKSPFFPLINVLGTITVCTFFLWYGGTIAAAAAETGLDTAKIESITGLKGVRTKRRTPLKSANRGMMLLSPLSRSAWLHLWGSPHGRPSPQE